MMELKILHIQVYHHSYYLHVDDIEYDIFLKKTKNHLILFPLLRQCQHFH